MITIPVRIVDYNGIDRIITTNVKDLPYLNYVIIPSVKTLMHNQVTPSNFHVNPRSQYIRPEKNEKTLKI